MKNIMVQHVPAMDNASTIFEEQINRIIKSNFLLEDNELHICLNGEHEPFLNTIEKIAHFNNVKFVLVHDNFLWCEIPTINYIKYICDNSVDDFYIGYIHLKGCSKFHIKPIRDWRLMMEFFIIDKYKKCTEFLDQEYDAVGCNWAAGGFIKSHFSGNFWWAQQKYIKKLDYLPNPDQIIENTVSKYTGLLYTGQEFRFDAEAWIGSKNPNIKEIYRSELVNKYNCGGHGQFEWSEDNYKNIEI